MLSNLKNLPTIPLVIGSVVTLMGCLLIAGMAYAVFMPPSSGVAGVRATATRKFVTVTPIMTMTPVPTHTATSTPTGLPTNPPTNTPVPPTGVPVTRVPPTAVPPTDIPVPPTAVFGADLGFDQLRFTMHILSNTRGLTLPFFIKLHNKNNYQVPFGYLGVAAHDSTGTSVAFRKVKINSHLEPDELFSAHDAIIIRKVGDFDVFFVICLSANDDICDQPGADYRQLAPPIRVSIHE